MVEDERNVNITIVLTGRTYRDVLIALSTRDRSALCEYYMYNIYIYMYLTYTKSALYVFTMLNGKE